MIHYHGGPLSGSKDVAVRFWRGRHAMVSFAYPDQLMLIAPVVQSFALDNGAFTTWKQGQTFDLKGYGAWVGEWARHPGFAWCLAPDVIGGTEADNDLLLAQWHQHVGCWRTSSARTVPVWHLHESIDRLRRLAAQYDLVALGSSGRWANPGTPDWWDRIAEAMPAICGQDGRPCCRLHGLRMLNPMIFTRLPFASADSTNAAQNAGATGRFGMYPPLEAWQRANVIADRIEGFNSAPAWKADAHPQGSLFEVES